MGFASGSCNLTLEDILGSVSEAQILEYYLGIPKIPIVINSPFREDKRPSFGIYSSDGKKIGFKDFSTGDRGNLIELLKQLWGYSYKEVLSKLQKDISNINGNISIKKSTITIHSRKSTRYKVGIQCKVRPWRDYDIKYWEDYGIPLALLKKAHVYPISHKFVYKDGKEYIFGADKYAYVFVEKKEGKVTEKIYQPFNKIGFKWCNTHDSSVLGLWTLLPPRGKSVCICSSVKDALCLMANTGIYSICVQGEGYSMSTTAVNQLKKRFTNQYIMLDNDEPGLKNAEKLSKETGFTNVVLPTFPGGKDISDFYKYLSNKELFTEQMLNLFTN